MTSKNLSTLEDIPNPASKINGVSEDSYFHILDELRHATKELKSLKNPIEKPMMIDVSVQTSGKCINEAMLQMFAKVYYEKEEECERIKKELMNEQIKLKESEERKRELYSKLDKTMNELILQRNENQKLLQLNKPQEETRRIQRLMSLQQSCARSMKPNLLDTKLRLVETDSAIQEEHSANTKKYPCLICKKEFNSREEMKNHAKKCVEDD